jgi:hypothetical protein
VVVDFDDWRGWGRRADHFAAIVNLHGHFVLETALMNQRLVGLFFLIVAFLGIVLTN